jgi:Rrf2 family protein
LELKCIGSCQQPLAATYGTETFMKFSTKAEYGLRAMVNLARNYSQQSYSLNKIASDEKISLAYLERLIAKLKKANLVTSEKGVKGGYRLSKEPNQITVGEVIEVLEGTLSPFSCLDNNLCKQKGCAAKKVWRKLQVAVKTTLDEITLDELI